MNTKLLFLLLGIVLICSELIGQSIPSTLSNIYEDYVPKHGKPVRIDRINIFYDDGEAKVEKGKIFFSAELDTITERRYKDSELKTEIIFIFNSNKQLIHRISKQKIPFVGWQYETNIYKYDQSGLLERESTNSAGQIITKAIFQNDSLGNPVKMEIYNAADQLMGYETATYNYALSTWRYRTFHYSGKQILDQEQSLGPRKTEKHKYNEFGDAVLYPKSSREQNHIYYEIGYKYDELGNWVEQKIYKLEKEGNELVNRSLDRKLKRKIKYRK